MKKLILLAITLGCGSAISQTRSIQDFGAVCDGNTDDTAAVRAAVAYASAHSGITIQWPNCQTLVVSEIVVGGQQTTLANSVSTSESSISVASGTYVLNNVIVQVDTELMLVTAGGGSSTLTVLRGYNGSTQTPHAAGAGVAVSVANVGFEGSNRQVSGIVQYASTSQRSVLNLTGANQINLDHFGIRQLGGAPPKVGLVMGRYNSSQQSAGDHSLFDVEIETFASVANTYMIASEGNHFYGTYFRNHGSASHDLYISQSDDLNVGGNIGSSTMLVFTCNACQFYDYSTAVTPDAVYMAGNVSTGTFVFDGGFIAHVGNAGANSFVVAGTVAKPTSGPITIQDFRTEWSSNPGYCLYFKSTDGSASEFSAVSWRNNNCTNAATAVYGDDNTIVDSSDFANSQINGTTKPASLYALQSSTWTETYVILTLRNRGTNDVINNLGSVAYSLPPSFTGMYYDSVGGTMSVAGGGSPTAAAGAAAGTRPTVGIAPGSDNASGTITVTTGTAPAVNAAIATVTFGATLNASPRCFLDGANAASQALAAARPFATSESTAKFVIKSNAAALMAGTTYSWKYACFQ